MRSYIFLLATIVCYCSCNNRDQKTIPASRQDTVAVLRADTSFFPVTSYIKGQLLGFLQQKLTPLVKITRGEKTDSFHLKPSEVNQAVTEFLSPLIDTGNLKGLYKEEKFNDQTINAITFTYDPKKELPDTVQLRHWDVYIDPELNCVSKIYIVKQRHDSIFQLTWVNDKCCSIRTFINKAGTSSTLESEKKITWRF